MTQVRELGSFACIAYGLTVAIAAAGCSDDSATVEPLDGGAVSRPHDDSDGPHLQPDAGTDSSAWELDGSPRHNDGSFEESTMNGRSDATSDADDSAGTGASTKSDASTETSPATETSVKSDSPTTSSNPASASSTGSEASGTETTDATSSDPPEPVAFTVEKSFTLSGTQCAAAFDPERDLLFVYQCMGDHIFGVDAEGEVAVTLDAPGEPADDVDMDVATMASTIGETVVPAGTLLFANGDTGVAELYAIDTYENSILTSVTTEFGADHVVGAGYHPERDTMFLLQDQSGGAAANSVAEVSLVTGDVLNQFSVQSHFTVEYGDIDVCPSTSNLLVVSSSFAFVGEFTPEGTFVQSHPLPEGVSHLGGIAIDDVTGLIWGVSTTGVATRLDSELCIVDE